MSASITVKVSGLSGMFNLELPEGSSVADARESGEINDGLVIRADGQTVGDESATEVRDGQTLVTTPPEAKHGLVSVK